MTSQQIAADVARGLEIKAEIARLEAELKAIEQRLEAAGLAGAQIPLQDPEREGKQFLACGTAKIVPVRFESDQIVGSFAPDSPMHVEAAAIAGDHLKKFFRDVRKFERVPKDGNDFRKVGRKLLTAEAFAQLVRACTARDKTGLAKSKTVIGWNDAMPVELKAS